MIGLIGYNFCKDGNAVDPTPTNINNITKTRLQNGNFDHFNVSKNTIIDSTIPTLWDLDTIMDADFNGNISAGNVNQVATGITAVRIKRRIKGAFDWITIREIPIKSSEDLKFVITDNLASYGTEYEYAFVPLTEDIEGSYIVESVTSKFEGVFICDVDTIFKFYAGVEYGNNTANQQVGVFQPYNRQYPVIVSNSLLNYQTGSVSGWVLPDDFDTNRQLDRITITKEKEAMLAFFMNKKPKILKDTNGNSWLVYITGNPTMSYVNNYGQGMVKISADWTEVGDSENKNDLYDNGLIPTKR